MQGHFFWRNRTEEGLNRALEYFQKAVEIDPDYALAHVGVADAYTMLERYGFVPILEVLPKIKEGVKKALEIDDKLEAHILSNRVRELLYRPLKKS